jgi:Family of unknown function (DUF6221)
VCDDGRVDDLTAFVNARLDEDEYIAQGAARTDDGHAGKWLPVHFGAGGFDARVDDHIGRHDPARALREVGAGRAILDRHMPHETAFDGLACNWCSEDVDDRPQIAKERWPCPDVRSLAAVWSDHPDYRQEWKP